MEHHDAEDKIFISSYHTMQYLVHTGELLAHADPNRVTIETARQFIRRYYPDLLLAAGNDVVYFCKEMIANERHLLVDYNLAKLRNTLLELISLANSLLVDRYMLGTVASMLELDMEGATEELLHNLFHDVVTRHAKMNENDYIDWLLGTGAQAIGMDTPAERAHDLVLSLKSSEYKNLANPKLIRSRRQQVMDNYNTTRLVVVGFREILEAVHKYAVPALAKSQLRDSTNRGATKTTLANLVEYARLFGTLFNVAHDNDNSGGDDHGFAVSQTGRTVLFSFIQHHAFEPMDALRSGLSEDLREEYCSYLNTVSKEELNQYRQAHYQNDGARDAVQAYIKSYMNLVISDDLGRGGYARFENKRRRVDRKTEQKFLKSNRSRI